MNSWSLLYDEMKLRDKKTKDDSMTVCQIMDTEKFQEEFDAMSPEEQKAYLEELKEYALSLVSKNDL